MLAGYLTLSLVAAILMMIINNPYIVTLCLLLMSAYVLLQDTEDENAERYSDT
jgi:hypothetical protein